jgi:hypothetical protein
MRLYKKQTRQDSSSAIELLISWYAVFCLVGFFLRDLSFLVFVATGYFYVLLICLKHFQHFEGWR